MAEVVEHLLSKREALGSILSIEGKKILSRNLVQPMPTFIDPLSRSCGYCWPLPERGPATLRAPVASIGRRKKGPTFVHGERGLLLYGHAGWG
jgi:hypothetical protein